MSDKLIEVAAHATVHAMNRAPGLRRALDELTARMIATADIDNFIKAQEQLYADALAAAYVAGARCALGLHGDDAS